MDEKIVDEILDELFSSFEKAETDSAAILLLLKERGIASDEKLAPFIEQASRTSEVRWRAARVRMGALLKSAMKTPEQPAEQKTAANRDQDKKPAAAKEEKKEPAEMNQPETNPKPKADAAPEAESEKTTKPKSEDSKTAPESNQPAAGETKSPGKNTEETEHETKAAPQMPTKR
jgi:outer membrane biosynthesis protein TonB